MPGNHPQIKTGKCGVLLINLGTPEHYDPKSVRQYLAEFLSDPRVIELTPWLWKPVLYGVILPTRPARVAQAYQKIWHRETDESPLKYYTRLLAERLQQRHSRQTLIIDYAMRYGKPSIEQKLRKLHRQGCDRILILPLYPQYSATTTATVVDKVNQVLAAMRWQPCLRFVPPYYDNTAYIHALEQSVRFFLQHHGQQTEAVLLSFHGLPEENLQQGDPYYCHCMKTSRLLQQQLNDTGLKFYTAFQSRFGPKKWLKPYASELIAELAQNGLRHLAVLAPGFACDCLETIEEMGIENKQLFLEHGGSDYQTIDCLNAGAWAQELYQQILDTELAGWITDDKTS